MMPSGGFSGPNGLQWDAVSPPADDDLDGIDVSTPLLTETTGDIELAADDFAALDTAYQQHGQQRHRQSTAHTPRSSSANCSPSSSPSSSSSSSSATAHHAWPSACGANGRFLRFQLACAVAVLLVLVLLLLADSAWSGSSTARQRPLSLFHTAAERVAGSLVGSTAFTSRVSDSPVFPGGRNSTAYSACLASFQRRSHPLNDGVSLRINMFSVWNSNATRAMWRSIIGPWLPPAVHFDAACQAYADGRYQSLADVGRGVAKRRLPEHFCDHRVQGNGSDSASGGGGSSGSSNSNGSYDISWWSMYDNIELVFVMGVLPSDDARYNVSMAALAAEQSEHGDLVVMTDMVENMDDGKSLHAIRTHARLNQERRKRAAQVGYSSTADYEWDYVMKLDDDSFLHVPNLIRQLRVFRAARLREVYYGAYLVNPGKLAPPSGSMAYHGGAGYILSADLVAWFISESSHPIVNWTFTYAQAQGGGEPVQLPNTRGRGYEDMNVGQWLTGRGRWLGRDKSPVWQGFTGDADEAYRLHHALVLNFYNAAADIYNIPNGDYYSRPQFVNSTILVHRLKHQDRINATVRHFICRQPQLFHWDRNWWYKCSADCFNFTEAGDYIPSTDWWKDTGQAYRLSKPNYTSPADLEPSWSDII